MARRHSSGETASSATAVAHRHEASQRKHRPVGMRVPVPASGMPGNPRRAGLIGHIAAAKTEPGRPHEAIYLGFCSFGALFPIG